MADDTLNDTDELIDDTESTETATVEVLDWDGERVDASDALQESGASYGYYVIEDRALPDVRDGFKPVHRRVLWAMADKGMFFDRKPQKCAQIVGEVIGRYHPHGDSSIYGALVNMTQGFRQPAPLIFGQGNFGDFDEPEKAAAYRYCVTGDTLVRLADGTTRRIADIVAGAYASSEHDIDLTVLDGRGLPAHASKFFHSGSHPTLRLRVHEDYELTGTSNHPVRCLELVDGKPKLTWKLLGRVQPGDWVVMARNAVVGDDTPLTDDERHLAVLAGGLVSEGWYSADRAGFNNTDPDYFHAVLAAFDHVVGAGRYVYEPRLIASGSTCWELDIQGKDVAALDASPLGDLAGLDSYTKRVPAAIWAARPAVKAEFLRALYEGDGSVCVAQRNSIRISYSTRSAQLAKDVQQLLLEFGIVTRQQVDARGDHQVLIVNRREARLFEQRIGFLTVKRQKLHDALAGIPTESRAMSRDHIPLIADYVRDNAPRGGRAWLSHHNIDRVERWERDRDLIVEKIGDPDLAAAVCDLVDHGYFFAQVSEVSDAGVQAVYSLRVDTDEHAFITNGFVSHNTEAKLTELGTLLKSDLSPDIVAFTPTFDEKTEEPTVLPVAFPALLVNGGVGIAFGMSCTFPPHNLGEVIDAALLVAEKDDVTLKQVMKKLPAPDYPTGGIIVNPETMEDLYATGRGTVLVQGKYHVENLPTGGQAIVVTELPYVYGQPNGWSKLFEQVLEAAKAGQEAVKKGKKVPAKAITEVLEKPLNQSDKNGDRLVIPCKRGGNIRLLEQQLLKSTVLQQSQSINFTALVDGIPRTLTLMDILKHFVVFRREVVTKRLEAEWRSHIKKLVNLSAQRAALDVIDKVIKIIRESKDDDDSREQLKKLLKVPNWPEKKIGEPIAKKLVPITDEQATMILNLPLKKINRLNQFELDEEIKGHAERVAEIEVILGDPAKINEIVCTEMRDVKRQFAKPRTTALSAGAAAAGDGKVKKGEVVADLPKTDVTVFVTDAGMGAAVERKGKLKAAPLKPGDSDRIVAVLDCDTDTELHAFTTTGTCYRLRAAELVVQRAGGKGLPVATLAQDEKVAAVLPVSAGPFLALVTRGGQIKRIAGDLLADSHGGGVPAMNVGDDTLVGVIAHDEGDEVLVHTSDGLVLRTPMKPIRVVKGGAAGGVALMSVQAGAQIVSAMVAKGDSLVIAHETGNGKTVGLDEYPVKGKGGKGQQSANVKVPTKNPAGAISCAAAVAGGEVEIISAKGQVLRQPLPKQGARGPVASQPWLTLGPGDEPAIIRGV